MPSGVRREGEGGGRRGRSRSIELLQGPENSLVPAEANFHAVAAEPEESGLTELGSVPLQDTRAEDKLQVGLALPRGAPGTNCSTGAAAEPPSTSGEIWRALSLQGVLSSPLGCELPRGGWRGPGDNGGCRQRGSAQGHAQRAAGHAQAAGGRAGGAAPAEGLQEGRMCLDGWGRRGAEAGRVHPRTATGGFPVGCPLPALAGRWRVGNAAGSLPGKAAEENGAVGLGHPGGAKLCRAMAGAGLAQGIRLVTGMQWEEWASVVEEKRRRLFSRAFPWVLTHIHSCVCPAGTRLQFPDR